MFLQGNWAYPLIKKINRISICYLCHSLHIMKVMKSGSKIDASWEFQLPVPISEAVGKFLDYVFLKKVSEYYAEEAGAYSCI